MQKKGNLKRQLTAGVCHIPYLKTSPLNIALVYIVRIFGTVFVEMTELSLRKVPNPLQMVTTVEAEIGIKN